MKTVQVIMGLANFGAAILNIRAKNSKIAAFNAGAAIVCLVASFL